MSERIQNAVTANIAALAECLHDAAKLAEEANSAMQDGKQNLAIGTIADFNNRLPEAQALYSAAIALHKRPS